MPEHAEGAESARIQADALREAADLLVAECSTVAAPCFCSSAPWLRDRADALERTISPGSSDNGGQR